MKHFFTETVVRDPMNLAIAPEPLLQSTFLPIAFGGELEGVRVKVFPVGTRISSFCSLHSNSNQTHGLPRTHSACFLSSVAGPKRRVEVRSLHGVYELTVRANEPGLSKLWAALMDASVTLRWSAATDSVELTYGIAPPPTPAPTVAEAAAKAKAADPKGKAPSAGDAGAKASADAAAASAAAAEEEGVRTLMLPRNHSRGLDMYYLTDMYKELSATIAAQEGPFVTVAYI